MTYGLVMLASMYLIVSRINFGNSYAKKSRDLVMFASVCFIVLRQNEKLSCQTKKIVLLDVI